MFKLHTIFSPFFYTTDCTFAWASKPDGILARLMTLDPCKRIMVF